MKIHFHVEGHKYIAPNNKPTISVTGLLKEYVQEMDSNYWLHYKAYERILTTKEFKRIKRLNFKEGKRVIAKPEFEDLKTVYEIYIDDSKKIRETIKIIKDEWKQKAKKATEEGSAYHDEREQLSYSRGYEYNPFSKKRVPTISLKETIGKHANESYRLEDLKDGYYPELLVYLEFDTFVLCGQVDKCWIYTINGNKYADIDDYKTNEKNPSNFSFSKCKAPIEHLPSSTHTKYMLQIMTYGYILEQHGILPIHLAYTHVKSDTLNKIEYQEGLIESIIQHYIDAQRI